MPIPEIEMYKLHKAKKMFVRRYFVPHTIILEKQITPRDPEGCIHSKNIRGKIHPEDTTYSDICLDCGYVMPPSPEIG